HPYSLPQLNANRLRPTLPLLYNTCAISARICRICAVGVGLTLAAVQCMLVHFVEVYFQAFGQKVEVFGFPAFVRAGNEVDFYLFCSSQFRPPLTQGSSFSRPEESELTRTRARHVTGSYITIRA